MTTPDVHASLPPPPREVTRTASRRAWGDIHVRFWWLSAIGVGLVIAYFSMIQINRGLYDREIIRNGIPVDTVIKKAGEADIHGHSVLRSGDVPVTLVGKIDGEERTFIGKVGPGPGYLKVGNPLTIRVHRGDPNQWTAEQQVKPWTRELAVSLMFLPLIAGLLVGALVVRRRLLRVWRNGIPVEGKVVDLRHSAWAPLSRVVRYSILDSHDRRIFNALTPTKSAPAKGDTIQLLAPPDGGSKPTILARLYAS